ncbi:hypothetical protein G6702_05270 [Polynucleobacter paneuropaeus]|nr:hypothetical protein [Polynucleobacter paneuropaeus]QWD15391.1 hypothetical protein G6702_05270 [Polynucleobacter paneuropaeus]
MFAFLLQLFTSHSAAFEWNDGGRHAAGFQGRAGDCVVRAIAIAASKPYTTVYEDLREANASYAVNKKNRLARSLNARGASPRNGNHRDVFHDYILKQGFIWVPTMQVGQGCQVHLRADELPHGKLIVRLSKHLTAMIDGVIYDTHDPSRGGKRCVYGYYIKH